MGKERMRSGRPQRVLRVGEIVRHALADILAREELAHPELYGVAITISEVRMSPDLKRARCYCLRLGSSGVPVAPALEEMAGFLRGRLGRRVGLKYTPLLSFIDDSSFDEAARIERLLDSHGTRRD